MDAPTFSVLIAAYNQAEYIEDTLDTVAAQTCADYEIVVVNDGSTDDTEARVTRWMESFQREHANRVVFSTTENGGQSAAFEHGFSLCTGRYICLLDSDDRWLPEKLARVMDVVRADGAAGMIMHPLYVIDVEGRRTGDVRPKRAKISEGDVREEVRRTSRHVAPATTGIVIRADVFQRLVPTPARGFRTHADLYLTLGACLEAPVRAMDEPLGEYRMHPNGQHVRAMLSPEGLGRYVELQTTLIRHFGLESAAKRNSYFVRHEFALSKLRGAPGEQISTYRQLMGATWRDSSFGVRDKVLFSGYWTVCLAAPRPLFSRLWRAFQLRQTGFDRIGLEATPESGI
ncbi:MAG TPA: glycosyltransferase [Longimicrobium sp.]|jgi:glycosyltransferase involved in cell wall biosynthesis